MAGLRPCLWTVLQCKQPDFQRFLDVADEQAAARRVKELCEVDTRKQLDTDPTAQARWNEQIRRAYLNYQQNKESADAHRND